MNVPSPMNPNKTPITETGRDDDLNVAVNFSEASLCDFSDWLDGKLAALEIHFATYITHKSQKRSFGR